MLDTLAARPDGLTPCSPLDVSGHPARGVSAVRWRREVANAGLPPLSGPLASGDEVDIRRSDVFELGSADITDANAVQLWYASTAWGLGSKGFRMHQKLRGLAGSGQSGVDALTRAWGLTRAGAPPAECAGALLGPRGAPIIPFFGAAFATKFLYFPHGATEPRNVILDAVVARRLQELGVWASAPTHRWWPTTYERYCDLLGRWSVEWRSDTGEHVRPDQFELSLFRPAVAATA